MKGVLLFLLMIANYSCTSQVLNNVKHFQLDSLHKCIWEEHGMKIKDSIINQRAKATIYKNKKIIVFNKKRYLPCYISAKIKTGFYVMSFFIFETRQLDKIIATPIKIIVLK
jgi:hypothetical protein